MSKIKDIIDKIKMSNVKEYHDLMLTIAKRVWLIVATLYYVVLLFTVGGFYFGPFTLEILSRITFHLYSVLVIATGWMLYSLSEYVVAISFPEKKSLLIGSSVCILVFVVIALLYHLGILDAQTFA